VRAARQRLKDDRHGTRIWRQVQLLMGSEPARRSAAEVAVPYGLCMEPSNAAADGHNSPSGSDAWGCSHFRTDVSFFPDLKAYLADLLRSREQPTALAATPGP
jgi:hypothetical protein